MSAQATLLRAAARLMRQRAEAANTDEARHGIHCASWHPLVALAVAELLEDEADRIDGVPYRVDSDWIERNYRAPIAVARFYLQDGPA